MKLFKYRVILFYIDAKTFGKHEPGNKVYYDELDTYFEISPSFVQRNSSFKKDIVPVLKVALRSHRKEHYWHFWQLALRYHLTIPLKLAVLSF